jgi:Domain of unknown function (DUF2431)/Zinc finger, C2H2 type
MGCAEDKEDDPCVVYLTLGDGDFSWSLDLARHLSAAEEEEKHRTALINGFPPPPAPPGTNNNIVQLIATGIDELAELFHKYKNSAWILKELTSSVASNSTTSTTPDAAAGLSLHVRHGVNAIVVAAAAAAVPQHHLPVQRTAATAFVIPRANLVFFHHPHLGVEDAALHSQFLSHLFHSVSTVWMKEDGSGVFYLTLVKGQYERWKCMEAAMRHGWELVERFQFDPSPDVLTNPSYQHRRHQTGKSFASRTAGSETFQFVRTVDRVTTTTLTLPEFPWFVRTIPSVPEKTNLSIDKFVCDECQRSFGQERSLRNHVLNKHGKKRKLVGKDEESSVSSSSSVRCLDCDRTFVSFDSLEDHKRAKHGALHANIRPEWASTKTATVEAATTANDTSTAVPLIELRATCHICGYIYTDECGENEHWSAFVPVETATRSAEQLPCCQFCGKVFRDQRAKLQHENFCKPRKEHASLTSS